MILNAIDKRIRKAFSDAALQYEVLTSLHKEIGRELTKKILEIDQSEFVLDVGMGTGWYTNRLTNIFPDSVVVGLDFASGMIDTARKKEGTFKIVQADASQLPFKEGVFDIITSNLAYQWVQQLSEAFEFCYSRLTQGGCLCFTMFGHDTFQELFEALETCSQEKNTALTRLANKDQVLEALQNSGFRDARLSTEHIKVRFSDMMSLIKWVRDIGANGLPNEIYLGKELFLKANEYYNDHFQDRLGIYATFEVIWVEANR